MRTLIILLLCTNTSFAIAQISPKAVEKNNQSVKTAGFFNDSDSLNKAIHLSDGDSFGAFIQTGICK